MDGFADAYLDIETTGLSSYSGHITVIGIYFHNGEEGQLVQLYNEKLNCSNLLKCMEGTENMFTYNGDRFDLPFIKAHLGADLGRMHNHIDLMFDCWKLQSKGWAQGSFAKLDIDRKLKG